MNADADIVIVAFAEPREEILADGFDRAEGLVVDGRGAFGKAAVRGRTGKLLADEAAAVPSFDKPKIVGALLPGPLHYVSIAAPVPGCDTYVKVKAHASFGQGRRH